MKLNLFSVKGLRYVDRLFIATVILPTLFAIFYFGILASDQFVSESRFLVRSPEKPSVTGMGVLLKTAGFSGSGDEMYAAQSYTISRDALRAIDKDGAFRRAYGASSISIFDRFNGFGLSGTFEDLYDYYRGKVRIEHDSTSGITTLTVRGFGPADAQKFNRALLDLTETTVNRLSDRGRQDLINSAQAEVRTAQERAARAALNLSGYRNRHGVIDPERQATVQLQMISKLQDELIATQLQLTQLRTVAPRNPQVPVLETRIAGLREEIDSELKKVAGGEGSLSSSAAQFQRLALESQFADKALAAAMASLTDAQNEAARKHAYVERIVEPNRPDSPIEPRRLRGVLATLLLGLVAWGILKMLIAGIREHQD